MKLVKEMRFGEERALYGARDLHVQGCTFAGEEDGESALKESCGVFAERCDFALRYPFWHNTDLQIDACEMKDTCRAPLWYCRDVKIRNSHLYGTKAVRECEGITVDGCDICSEEFGWFSKDLCIRDTDAQGAYFLLQSKNVVLENLRFKGKYSFQYVENLTAEGCELDTKDAFWHAKNATVTDSVLRGEYVGWYSENLTLIRCRISGTQPFCYCKNLRLIDCELTDADFAFEKSGVEATLTSHVLSIKNPLSGRITLPSVGEVIMDDPAASGQVFVISQDA